MKLLFILFQLSIASFASVLNIQANTGWTDLPYCNGRTKLTCENAPKYTDSNDNCYLEIINSNCTKINLYTASTFYPSVWTVYDKRGRNENKKIKISPNNLSGLEQKYFYVFFAADSNAPYVQMKFTLPRSDN